MATVICKNCNAEIDTDLACQDIVSLFGLCYRLESQLETKSFDADLLDEVTTYFRKNLVSQYGPESEIYYEQFKAAKTTGKVAQTSMTRLYLVCPNGHRNYYDIDCKA